MSLFFLFCFLFLFLFFFLLFSCEVSCTDEPTNPQAIIQPTVSQWRFDSEAAYVIAGGLGAMGRIIARWMASKGARHLVLLSRSGPRPGDSEVIAFIQELETTGTTIYHPACDISNPDSLAQALDHCIHRGMPPIKGCIQAAMVLRDGFFDNLDHADWSESLIPKMDGSWNLHQQLPRDLDFFILLSSVSGIFGSHGQSNYATANTFQDELARYRVETLGERAISIDLSLVGGEGFSVQHPELAQQLLRTKHIVEMKQEEMLGVLDRVCGPYEADDPLPYQIVMGLDLPKNAVARGMDLPAWMQDPMFANLHQLDVLQSPSDGDDVPGENGAQGLAG